MFEWLLVPNADCNIVLDVTTHSIMYINGIGRINYVSLTDFDRTALARSC